MGKWGIVFQEKVTFTLDPEKMRRLQLDVGKARQRASQAKELQVERHRTNGGL